MLLFSEINSLEQLKKDALGKHKKRKGLKNMKGENQEHMIQDNSTSKDISTPIALDSKVKESPSEQTKSKEKIIKVRGIKKAKVRQREM